MPRYHRAASGKRAGEFVLCPAKTKCTLVDSNGNPAQHIDFYDTASAEAYNFVISQEQEDGISVSGMKQSLAMGAPLDKERLGSAMTKAYEYDAMGITPSDAHELLSTEAERDEYRSFILDNGSVDEVIELSRSRIGFGADGERAMAAWLRSSRGDTSPEERSRLRQAILSSVERTPFPQEDAYRRVHANILSAAKYDDDPSVVSFASSIMKEDAVRLSGMQEAMKAKKTQKKENPIKALEKSMGADAPLPTALENLRMEARTVETDTQSLPKIQKNTDSSSEPPTETMKPIASSPHSTIHHQENTRSSAASFGIPVSTDKPISIRPDGTRLPHKDRNGNARYEVANGTMMFEHYDSTGKIIESRSVPLDKVNYPDSAASTFAKMGIPDRGTRAVLYASWKNEVDDRYNELPDKLRPSMEEYAYATGQWHTYLSQGGMKGVRDVMHDGWTATKARLKLSFAHFLLGDKKK